MNLKNTLICLLILILLGVGFYHLLYLPSLKNEYQRGWNDCAVQKDTVLLPGKPIIENRDTSFAVQKPIIREKTQNNSTKDSINVLTSIFDTTMVSGNDTISTHALVSIKIDEHNNASIADWIMKIKHADYIPSPDTMKIYVPKLIEKIVTETNWLVNGIAYVAGVITATILFFLGK